MKEFEDSVDGIARIPMIGRRFGCAEDKSRASDANKRIRRILLLLFFIY
jgi:hypothetical protein